MHRYNSITLIQRALLFSVVILLAGNGRSYGQQSDIDSVKAAIEAYHAAIESLTLSEMEPLWAHDSSATMILPVDRSVSVGWDAVQKHWEYLFIAVSSLKLTQVEEPVIQVQKDMAWSTDIVNEVVHLKTGATYTRNIIETDIFEKQGDKWLLVSLAASQRPM
jgi:ketosteroid isomerase-like protein